jgi:hypothetical protein
MKSPLLATLALAFIGAGASPAATIVYDNTATDTQVTYFYSTGPYVGIGDSITLGGTDRVLDSATVQFYNALKSTGTFSATLNFYEAGSPAGAPIGGQYVVDNILIPFQDIVNVTFTNLNLLVPDNLAFLVGITNVTGTVDLGLNAYTAPSPGSSDDAAIVVSNGSFIQTGSTARGEGNLYLILDANTPSTGVPEPGTVTLVGGALIGVLAIARKRNAS